MATAFRKTRDSVKGHPKGRRVEVIYSPLELVICRVYASMVSVETICWLQRDFTHSPHAAVSS